MHAGRNDITPTGLSDIQNLTTPGQTRRRLLPGTAPLCISDQIPRQRRNFPRNAAAALLNRNDKQSALSDEELKEDMKALQKFKEFSSDRRRPDYNRQHGTKQFGQQSNLRNGFNNHNNRNNSKKFNGAGCQEHRVD
ncbi:hypothetical protein BGW38_001915, partial [Lunasporangiospora selenospora]